MDDKIEVTVGKVGRAHGINGDVWIDVRTDEPGRRFVPGARLLLGSTGREIELSAVRWNKGRLVVSFVGYPDRTAVAHLEPSPISQAPW